MIQNPPAVNYTVTWTTKPAVIPWANRPRHDYVLHLHRGGAPLGFLRLRPITIRDVTWLYVANITLLDDMYGWGVGQAMYLEGLAAAIRFGYAGVASDAVERSVGASRAWAALERHGADIWHIGTVDYLVRPPPGWRSNATSYAAIEAVTGGDVDADVDVDAARENPKRRKPRKPPTVADMRQQYRAIKARSLADAPGHFDSKAAEYLEKNGPTDPTPYDWLHAATQIRFVCKHCKGRGRFDAGLCYQCRGAGTQDDADRTRNINYAAMRAKRGG